ncbi:glycosyltransferase family 2 protein [Microbacterium suaedae]|uniref:glycosyltransferase family 2 protein n=1 Tax=Microbacterium suaedae TaxID=2067813 RepID=UPI000DA13CAC|nr:glycosyltransferase family 2 protein [Microbacterium suaedae]
MRGTARPHPEDLSAPLLTVVIPTHDVGPWLRQTLDSVLRQLDRLEVIVVDDRSTDGTLDLARSYAERDARVEVMSAPTPGGGSARNAGAERARGQYLVFADGDDLVPDGAYAALVDSLEASGSDMAVGDYIKFRAVDTWRPTAAMPAFDRAAQRIALEDAPTLLYSRPCWNRAFRTGFWRDSGIQFPDVPRSNDIVPMVSALVAADSIDVVEDVVYVYRERPGSGSMTARAGAATSLVSYLTQETVCARIVRERRSAELDRVYSNLVWDRDGFVAVSRYALAWREPGDGDALVARHLTELLEITPPPAPEVGPLRRLTLELAAAGDFAAAHAVARVAAGAPEGDDESGRRADLVGTWRALFAAIPKHRPLSNVERDALVERLARQVAQPRPADPGPWRTLLMEAEDALGPRARLFAADAWQSPDGDEDRIAERARTDARVEAVAGGHLLAIDGVVSAESGDVRPALLDGEASADAGEMRLVEAASVTWATSRGGARAYSSAFPATGLPMHRPLTPVVVTADGKVLGVEAALELPPYSPRDAFLYDAIDGVLVVRRRRHWIPRAARRALHIVIARLRRR